MDKKKEDQRIKELKDRYIRFDWAIKRLLRQKANFGVLEGFLTVFSSFWRDVSVRNALFRLLPAYIMERYPQVRRAKEPLLHCEKAYIETRNGLFQCTKWA